MQRRTLFQFFVNLGILSWLNLPSKWFSAGPLSQLTVDERDTFAAYLDTLIPADDVTPSAIQVGILDKVLAPLSNRPQHQQIVMAACQWLNGEALKLANKPFVELNEEQREHIVTQAERSKENTVPRVFFEMTRREAFVHYYADSRSWKGLPGAKPPQPLGAMDYSLPPPSK